MATYKLYNQLASAIGEIKLSDEVFKAEYNPSLINEVVVAQAAAKRQGTKSTLTRSEVVGGKKQPYRQKGTGRARQGSTVSIHHVGGGVAFAPKPRDFDKKVNKQAKQNALKSALSKKLSEKSLIFVDKLELSETVDKKTNAIVKQAKTKDAVKILDAFKADRSTLFVLDSENLAFRRAARNIEKVETVNCKLLNLTEVVKFNKVIMTEGAAKYIEEALK